MKEKVSSSKAGRKQKIPDSEILKRTLKNITLRSWKLIPKETVKTVEGDFL